MEKAGNLVQEAEEIQQLVERKHRLATNKSLAVETGLKEMLQGTQPLEEVSALWLDLPFIWQQNLAQQTRMQRNNQLKE